MDRNDNRYREQGGGQSYGWDDDSNRQSGDWGRDRNRQQRQFSRDDDEDERYRRQGGGGTAQRGSYGQGGSDYDERGFEQPSEGYRSGYRRSSIPGTQASDFSPFTGQSGGMGQAGYGSSSGYTQGNFGSGQPGYSSGQGYSQGGQDRQGGWQRSDDDHRHAHDPHYSQWRRNRLEEFDRDYDEYRKERQGEFDKGFDDWRSKRTGSTASGGTGASAEDKKAGGTTGGTPGNTAASGNT